MKQFNNIYYTKMSLINKTNASSVEINNSTSEPVNIQSAKPLVNPFNIKTTPEIYNNQITLGAFYFESNEINTTERQVGMPIGSNDDLTIKLTTPAQLQFTSTSANDASGGTGATEIFIEGLTKIGTQWDYVCETFVPTGTTAVLTTSTVWWRINNIFVTLAGSGGTNDGDFYISEAGAGLTAGVPDASETLYAALSGYGRSSMGIKTVASGFQTEYYQLDFYADSGSGADMRIHEIYFENFDKTNDNLVKYEIATYTNMKTGVQNHAYQPFDEKSDICITIRRSAGSQTDPITFYYQTLTRVKNGDYTV